ncbi:MAG TPA: M4 family metallopeptidase, partial [bacterium]|nr:M4 family metallopeptidase [bacterium]
MRFLSTVLIFVFAGMIVSCEIAEYSLEDNLSEEISNQNRVQFNESDLITSSIKVFKGIASEGLVFDWNEKTQSPLYVKFGNDGFSSNEFYGMEKEELALYFMENVSDAFRLQPEDELKFFKKQGNEGGFTTIKLTQTYKGIPVDGAMINVGLGPKNQVRVLIGALVPDLALDVNPFISDYQAIEAVKESEQFEILDATAELVIYSRALVGEESSGKEANVLAWKIVTTTKNPLNDKVYYLDAQSLEKIKEIAVAVSISREVFLQGTDMVSSPYGALIMDETNGHDTTDQDAIKSFDLAQMYNNFLVNNFFPNGFSSVGNLPYRVIIHSSWAASSGGAYFQNGYKYAAFSSGMVALDTFYHEWTHGFLFNTANLEYNLIQSQALHEAIADMIASFNDVNWTIGESTDSGQIVRRIDYPNDGLLLWGYHDHMDQYDDEDKYKESTIFSQAGYLYGETEGSVHYHRLDTSKMNPLFGIGRNNAGRITIYGAGNYLFPTANFKAGRWAILQGCNDLVEQSGSGINSSYCTRINSAFNAVGITKYSAPTVTVYPVAGDVSGCIDQSGTGFPNKADITLIFKDEVAGFESRTNVVSDSDGNVVWYFGLECEGIVEETEAIKAKQRAESFLNRVDPNDVGFTGRQMLYRAEYWDGGLVNSNSVAYTLTYTGECTPVCDGKSCGPDGCGGYCGTCYGTKYCNTGVCTDPGAPVTTKCGNIDGNETWNLAMSPVKITCDVTVNGSLTIMPGVIVEFQDPDDDLYINMGANFTANGDKDNPIIFTSDGEMAVGSWGGIYFNGDFSSGQISYAEFRHGGKFTNSRAGGFPIKVNKKSPTISNIKLISNRRNAVGLELGNYSSNIRLSVVGVPYYIEANYLLNQEDLIIGAGSTLTIDPGVIVKLHSDEVYSGHGADIYINGRIVANGTAEMPIYFTSFRNDMIGGDSNADGNSVPASMDWGGIYLNKDALGLPASSLKNVVINYAGETDEGLRYPLKVSGYTQPTIESVTISSSRRNAIALDMGTYNSDFRLNIVGIPYYIESVYSWSQQDLTVAAGATMTVDPGVIIKFQDDLTYGNAADLIVNGRIVANGTAEMPIYFTS